MSKSEEYLKEAFAGESQANRRYLAFATKADREGYPQVARLFRAAAEAETVHAHNHLRALKGIRSTKENLQEAISGETHEFKSMYPEMIEAAKADGNKEAERTFRPSSIRSFWISWALPRRHIPITCARFVALRQRRMPRMSVPYVGPRGRCLGESINLAIRWDVA
jgi:hypothetical protein